MPQLTDDQIASFETGMRAMEALKTDIAPKLAKLNAFDEAKFDAIQRDIQAAMKASEDVKALEAKQADIEASRPSSRRRTSSSKPPSTVPSSP